MVFKQFRFNVILRVLVLTATCLAKGGKLLDKQAMLF